MVEERQRIAGRELLGPALAEAEGRRDQDERRRGGPPRDASSATIAPSELPTTTAGGSAAAASRRRGDDRSKVELLEGGLVQVRGDDAELVGREGLAEKGDLSARGGRGEAVEVEDGAHPAEDTRFSLLSA